MTSPFKTLLAALAGALLAGCGGQSGSPETPAALPAEPPASQFAATASITQASAARFLGQATFGPTSTDISAVIWRGYDGWLTWQMQKPASSLTAVMNQAAATLQPPATLAQNQFFEAFWQKAVTADDQLRQRVAYALSQIFVVSMVDVQAGGMPRGMAGYHDMLANNAFGNFRALLQNVALHPVMGVYLNALHNEKESGQRVPDQNFAREIMQLFSIGLVQLNQDGTPKLVNGAPVETYGDADIVGLSRVFTGWSWAGPDQTANRFYGYSSPTPDPDRDIKPMQMYPQFHSTLDKSFLGVTIPGGGSGLSDLKIALDTLFNHPNVGPFIGRQLIQRLVTSNPSPAYVARVAAAFADNGSGVRGDMKAVIKAVLLDPEARSDVPTADGGKLREPVLRLAHWMRSFNAKSASGRFLMTTTDDPVYTLGQSPLRSPSVFNFYRPGYTPPNTAIAAAGLVAPEFQITGETSVVGYLNLIRDVIQNGAGTNRDIKADYGAEIALAATPDKLVERINLLLTGGQMSADLKSRIVKSISSLAIPSPTGSNDAAINSASLSRVQAAIFLTMASPEYLIQK
ncbi:DUF1800 domain-containing protein [Noviherbaspirillum humi]|nr:DUF1800 domain-containing protein [Noviherbaspirillum humi]